MVVAGAVVFGRFLTVTRLPFEMAAWVTELPIPGVVVLLLMLAIYTLGGALMEHGFRLVSGGTDNHLLLVNVSNKGLTGKAMEELLEHVGITCNKNTVPFDQESPFVTSGVRLGTPALTTRGMGAEEMNRIADIIDRAVQNQENQDALDALRVEAEDLCKAFPLYPGM